MKKYEFVPMLKYFLLIVKIIDHAMKNIEKTFYIWQVLYIQITSHDQSVFLTI